MYYKAQVQISKGVMQIKDCAAIVTYVAVHGVQALDVEEKPKNQVRLTVFKSEGLFFTDLVDQGQEGGQWDWMPFQKDQQMRYANEAAEGKSLAAALGVNIGDGVNAMPDEGKTIE